VDILSTSEGEEPVTEVAPATPAEAAIDEAVTIGVAPTEVASGEVASIEVTTTITSASPGNDHNKLFSDCYSYIVFDFNNFAETTVATAPSAEAPREGVIVFSVVDLVELDYLYHSAIQDQISLVAELLVTVGMESAPSTLPVSEQIESMHEPIVEKASIPSTSLAFDRLPWQ